MMILTASVRSLAHRYIMSIFHSRSCSISYVSAIAGDLGEPVLLPVRISVSRFHHSDNFLLTDLNCHGLLPVVWRGNSTKSIISA